MFRENKFNTFIKAFWKKKSKKIVKMQTEFQKQMKAFAINDNPRNPRGTPYDTL